MAQYINRDLKDPGLHAAGELVLIMKLTENQKILLAVLGVLGFTAIVGAAVLPTYMEEAAQKRARTSIATTSDGVVMEMPDGSYALNIDRGGTRPYTFYAVASKPGEAYVPSGLTGKTNFDLIERIAHEFEWAYRKDHVRVIKYTAHEDEVSSAGWGVLITYTIDPIDE